MDEKTKEEIDSFVRELKTLDIPGIDVDEIADALEELPDEESSSEEDLELPEFDQGIQPLTPNKKVLVPNKTE